LLGLKLDSNLVWRSATELKLVVLASQDSCREARHALLASVEGIPDVVHHCVELVLETGLFVAQIYRLYSAVPAISIQVLELEQANIVSLTDVDLLILEVSAARVSSTNSLVIWNNDEVSRSLFRLCITVKLGVCECEDQIVGSRAREITAVLHISPSLRRLAHVCPA